MVVYYSLGGTTKVYAEVLAELLGDTPVALKETRPRVGVFGMVRGAMEALFKQPVALEAIPQPQAGKPLFICSPVWAGQLVPAVMSFVSGADLKKCKVNVILTCKDVTKRDAYKKSAAARLQRVGCAPGFVQVFAAPGKSGPDRDIIRRHLKKLVLNVDESF